MNESKPLPHAEGPEKSILSSMLQNPKVYVTRAKAEGVIPSMFYATNHAKLFSIFVEWIDDGKDLNLISLAQYLIDKNLMDAIGGPGMIQEIYTYSPTAAHFASHLSEVRDAYARRQAIKVAKDAINEASRGGSCSQDALSALSRGVDAVRLATAQKKAFTDARGAFDRFIEMMRARSENGELAGLSTGINELDAIGGGMGSGELWVICGETSGGKSVLSLQACNPAIDAGKKVLIFTLEMGVEEVFSRLVSCRRRVSMKAIMQPQSAGPEGGGLTQKQRIEIMKGAKDLMGKNLLITDEPNMSIDYVVSQCEIESESGPVGLIVVDYIQLLESTRRQGESREQELSRISKQLKQLAKRMKCPVITPAQLNDDGKLRESRAIGQDADVVLKITDGGVKVAKFRNAARDQLLPLQLVGEFQRFETTYDNQ